MRSGHRTYLIQFAFFVATSSLVSGVFAAPAIVEACKSCHAEDGAGVGKPSVPIIAGIPAVHLEEALYAYKDGARQCVSEPVMCETVLLLSDENIADLAEHYGVLPRNFVDEPFDANLAASGEQIHKRLCARCHVAPDHPDVDEVLGIPLHGQRSAYLDYALQSYVDGSRENLLPDMEEKVIQLDDDDVVALVNYYVSYRQD